MNHVETDAIIRQATTSSFDSAKLSDELRQERQRFRETTHERLVWFQKNSDSETKRITETQALLFSQHDETKLRKATGEFADMLTSAVIARRGRKDFSLKLRTQLWSKCLEFAMRLKRFEVAGVWIENAWRYDPRESPQPHLAGLESIAEKQSEAAKFSEIFRAVFEERSRHASPSWLSEADRRIELRCLLSAATQHRADSNDDGKKTLLLLLTTSRDLTTEQVCYKLASHR